MQLEKSGESSMSYLISIFGITLLSISLVLGCGNQEDPAKAKKPAAKKQAASAKQEATKQKPPARDHGQRETAKLQIYDDPSFAIRTQYPDTMEVEGMGSGEGSGFFFRFKPQGNALDQAEVHIFLPRGAATAADQEPFVTGPKGLIENNGWKKEGETTDTGKFPSEWVRKVISFADPKNKGMVGKILLGETSGQAVQVILYYPADKGDEFLNNAHLILGKLHYKSDKLPLKKSTL
jgi:hypothetical protein